MALKGEHSDGHEHVESAAEMGAAAALVARPVNVNIPQLIVADVEKALQQAAAQWRQSLDVFVLGITGSCGKTTVKQMLASILSVEGKTLATEGNLNNHLGVPLTLLGLTTEHRFAVVEMGASAAGDIALLCDIAKPNVGLITMVAAAHLDGFGSLEGIASAKGEIFAGLAPSGVAVMNADETWLPQWLEQSQAQLNLSFGSSALADVSVSKQHSQAWINDNVAGSRFVMNLPNKTVEINLPLPGWHNVMNACAAAAMATAAGVSADSVVAGLEKAENVTGRLQIQRLANGCLLVDDSYNANPASVRAAANWLLDADIAGQRVLVLGEMAELGDDSITIHKQVGAELAATGIDQLWACGGKAAAAMAEGFGDKAFCYENQSHLSTGLAAVLGATDAVLIKGSRSAAMERVVNCVAAIVAGHEVKHSGDHHAA